jgi:copper chaperone CopZ
VKDNEETLDIMRHNLRQKVIEDIMGILIKHDNNTHRIDKVEAQLLSRKITVMLEAYGVSFDEAKFLQAIALNPTLAGVIGTTRKLLPRDEPHAGDEELFESDIYDMFYIRTEDGSIWASAASYTGMRSFRETFAAKEEDDGCCGDEACGGHLANANFFLPPGVRPFKAESSRSISVRRLSLSVPKSSTNLLADEEEEPISRVGRSHFTATGICCSSEVPMVKSILLPIKGVESVKVSPATRAIYVDHDIDIVSASDICRDLDEGGFGATIVEDAAVEITQQIGIPMDVTVVSVFDVNIEDGKIGATSLKEEATSASLKSALGEAGIKMVQLSQRKNCISVEYNPYYVTSSQNLTLIE